MKNFHDADLPPQIVQSLEKMKFSTPTPIQARAIPPALEGKDILGTAQTGTGKTGAFAIPLLTKLFNTQHGMALVLTPTRELAKQVMATMHQLLHKNNAIKTALLIGGESMPKQFRELKMRPRLVVGTPGRINDHLSRGTLKINNTQFLVLDETDRMLDMGFGIQLEKIFAHFTSPRQTLMFSATLPNNIVKLAGKYLNNPVRISVGSTTTPPSQIKQEIIHLKEADKYHRLTEQLNAHSGSIIVFVKTKRGADNLSFKLNKENFNTNAIHGDLRQNKRDRVIKAFRNKKYRIIVATDIAARGLDIPHIEHVINYDLPQCPEDYIHRIGRTARAGASGSSVCFISPKDSSQWKRIHRLIQFNPSKARHPRHRQAESQ